MYRALRSAVPEGPACTVGDRRFKQEDADREYHINACLLPPNFIFGTAERELQAAGSQGIIRHESAALAARARAAPANAVPPPCSSPPRAAVHTGRPYNKCLLARAAARQVPPQPPTADRRP